MRYVDVILPLPLEGTFTYSVPPCWRREQLFGRRVLVPLGRSKTYTAIVVRQHDDETEYDLKDILALPDPSPMLLPGQYRLWQWIADYYMSPLGEVYKAALPSGLKAEDGYRPKTETCVALGEKYRSQEALRDAMDVLARASRQLEAFTVYLKLSDYGKLELTRTELLNAAKTQSATVKDLCDRGILATYEREVGRLGDAGEPNPKAMRQLSTPQSDAYNAILAQFPKKPVVLLHGVTSSGKTELYIHLIQRAIERGEQVLYLLPEIALTVQIMRRLRRVFGNRLGIYHSRYSDAERVEIWKKQLSATPFDVVLGARSAVFLPFRKLGLVIVDEEHEGSFKQQEPAPRYHARSVAIMLARMAGAKVLLGTATPSAESWHNARTGKYGYVELKSRFQGMELPEVEVVDIKDLRRRKFMKNSAFSPQLVDAMRSALAAGKQVLLFQNRRGFSPVVECGQCGWVLKCENCAVSLTYHRTFDQLTCHYCGYTYRVPTLCPQCGNNSFDNRGVGTERIEDELLALLPEAKVARMDFDSTRTQGAYDRIIDDFSRGETNVLIGTQMVTKGLDFDRVAVVGILDADMLFNKPDFRAYETAYQMIAQVSGRAGRKEARGKVFLQTRNAGLPLLRQIVDNDQPAFYAELLEERRQFRYPPYSHIIDVHVRHTQEPVAESAAQELAWRLRQWLGGRVLGPDKPIVARVKRQCLRKIVLKLELGINLAQVRDCLRQAKATILADKRYKTVTIYCDVDPL